jgi:hypothetical protein
MKQELKNDEAVAAAQAAVDEALAAMDAAADDEAKDAASKALEAARADLEAAMKNAEPAADDEQADDEDQPDDVRLPLPHEVAAAIGHDPIFALDIVIACANHEQNRRCPALANIVQSFAINRQEMVDWLDRVAQRTADRAARNEEAAK